MAWPYLQPGPAGWRRGRMRSIAWLALILAACSAAQPTLELVAVPTSPPAPLLESARACPAALLEGRLVPDDRWGIALQTEFGPTGVRWPHGYVAALDPGLVLLDDSGQLVARAGEIVYVGGGMDADNVLFVACGHVSPDPP